MQGEYLKQMLLIRSGVRCLTNLYIPKIFCRSKIWSQISFEKKNPLLIVDWPGKLVIKKYIRDLKKVLKLGLVCSATQLRPKSWWAYLKMGEAVAKNTHIFIDEEKTVLEFSIKSSLCILHVGKTFCKRFTGSWKEKKRGASKRNWPISDRLWTQFYVCGFERQKVCSFELILGHFITLWVAFWYNSIWIT